MKKMLLTVLMCLIACGIGFNVYAFPSMGSDCASCHGGGGSSTPGCGASGAGCNRSLLAGNGETAIGAEAPSMPAIGPFDVDVTKEDGLTIIHPKLDDVDFKLPVIVWPPKGKNSGDTPFANIFSAMASFGQAMVIPTRGMDKEACAARMAEKNGDPASKFFQKIDLDDIKTLAR